MYDTILASPLKRTLRNALAAGAALGAGQGLMFWVFALAFWYGGQLVESGEMTLSNTLKVLASLCRFNVKDAAVASFAYFSDSLCMRWSQIVGRSVARHESNACVQVSMSLLFATIGISQAQLRFPEVANGSKAVARVFRGAAHLVLYEVGSRNVHPSHTTGLI